MASSLASYGAMAVALASATILLDQKESIRKRRRRDRSVWVSEWVRKRETDGFCVTLLPELRCESPKLYKNFVRMSAADFDYLLALVTPLIVKQNTKMRKAIPPVERLALTLRYLATGDSYMSLQYLFRIPQTTISRIIPEVLDAIFTVLKDQYLRVPQTAEEWEDIARKYDRNWNIPNCIGAVDGKHVVMSAPPNSGSVYYNYKGTHSIVLMGIADAEYKLTYVDVGCNGRMSDGGVFNRCSFKKALDNGKLNVPMEKPLPQRTVPVPFVLVGDDAFAMKPTLLKPYSGKNLTWLQRVFNYRLSRARGKIENVFGLISARFRVLRKPIALDAEKTRKVTLACCALHNFLMTRNKSLYAPHGSFDEYDATGTLIPGEWRQHAPDSAFYPLANGTPYISEDAKRIRNEFAEYFVSEGDIPWQYQHI